MRKNRFTHLRVRKKAKRGQSSLLSVLLSNGERKRKGDRTLRCFCTFLRTRLIRLFELLPSFLFAPLYGLLRPLNVVSAILFYCVFPFSIKAPFPPLYWPRILRFYFLFILMLSLIVFIPLPLVLFAPFHHSTVSCNGSVVEHKKFTKKRVWVKNRHFRHLSIEGAVKHCF